MNDAIIPLDKVHAVSPFEGLSVSIRGLEREDELGLTQFASGWIDFGATGVSEIFQNIKYILITEYFSVVLDREFGMRYTMVDKPIPVAMLMLDQEVAMRISLYEPRAIFEEIVYAGDGLNGKLEPNVKCRVVVDTGIQGVVAGPVEEPSYLVQGLTDAQIAALPPEIAANARQTIAGILVPGPQGKQGQGERGPAGVAGPAGPKGDRGATWFSGPNNPGWPSDAREGDRWLNTVTGDVFIWPQVS